MSKKQTLHFGIIARKAVWHLINKTKKDGWLWGFLLAGVGEWEECVLSLL